jgi:alpha,alpha-trehalase
MLSIVTIIAVLVTVVFGSFDQADNCRIFCQGPLLEAVQNAHLFHDSKEFVDMPLKYSPDVTLHAFHQLANKSDVQTIKTFVDEHFSPAGTELQGCHPGDWVAKPKSFEKIQDPVYRQWAYDVHSKWRSLCRRMKDDVRKNQDLYSLISVPYPFIAPGGRFREFYYWDTYWIVKGLLASEMVTTAQNMIRNLADMVRSLWSLRLSDRAMARSYFCWIMPESL